jgi:hypothetical protein
VWLESPCRKLSSLKLVNALVALEAAESARRTHYFSRSIRKSRAAERSWRFHFLLIARKVKLGLSSFDVIAAQPLTRFPQKTALFTRTHNVDF